MAYVWGSAFYGIYFIVSFPGFYYLDANIDADIEKKANNKGKRVTLMDTFTIACGHGMMILILLFIPSLSYTPWSKHRIHHVLLN